MLEIKGITKKFGDIVALSEVSFSVDKGEFIFITGPSGAGKTTILKLILREILPDSGEIILDNKNIVDLPRKQIPNLRQKLGVVFQDFKVLPERTVRENVEIALAVCGIPSNEWDLRIKDVLKLVSLDKRTDLFPSQLSGGELQRVSLARALVVNPKILLADEPTGNLDWDTADSIIGLIEEVNKQGKTVIVATHHRLIVDKFKKRVIELKDGKVVKGNKRKVKDKKDSKENE